MTLDEYKTGQYDDNSPMNREEIEEKEIPLQDLLDWESYKNQRAVDELETLKGYNTYWDGKINNIIKQLKQDE